MSTLYGRLIASVARHYERSTAALNNNTALINRFGEVIKPLDLQPDVTPLDNGSIELIATCPRGKDHIPVLSALQAQGFKVGEATKPRIQLNDGYVMWTASVRGNSLDFNLLFYSPLDVS